MIRLASTRLLITWLGLFVAAQASANSIPYRHFSIADGLPHENIRSIAQTPDGRLWVGTSAGLSYYDGQGFVPVRFIDAVGTVNVLEVQPLKNDEVWISTNHQGVWQVRYQHAAQPYHELARVKASRILSHNDTLYVFSQREVWKAALGTDAISSLAYDYTKERLPLDAGIVSADFSPAGKSWVLDARLGPGEMHTDGSIRFLELPSAMTVEGWHSLRFDDSGMGWATHEEMGLFKFDPHTRTITRVLNEKGVRHICVTPQMIVVTSYNHGALYWDLINDRPMPPMNEAAGLPTNRINCIFRDHEGNAWIGTQIGLLYLSHPGVQHLIDIDEKPLVNLNSIRYYRDATVWASSYTEGLFQLFPEYKSVRPAGETRWSDLFEGQDGRLYALGLSGWHRYAGNETWEQIQSYAGASRGYVNPQGVGYFQHGTGIFRHEPGMPVAPLYTWPLDEREYVRHLLTPDGSILIWHNGRLVRISSQNASKWNSDSEPVKSLPAYRDLEINDMAEDHLGRVWVALLNNGLLCVEPDTVIQLLPGHQVHSVSVEGDSLLMANTQDGLYVFNLPKPEPEPSRLHLQADSTVRYHLSQADGLLSSMVVGATFAKNSLWLTHPGGVTDFPKALLRREPPIPTVLLTSINYNGIERPPSRPIELDSDQRNIGFAFSATTYVRPHQVRYRYRLKGYDKTWSETNRPFVQYAGLPSGAYQFEVQAAASPHQFGVPVSYDFSIPEPFYQKPAFWMVVMTMLTLLMYSMHKYRVRSILAVERTRTQIAMDLHDDIGSSLTSLSFLSNLAWQRTEQKTPREQISPLLAEIGSMSSELVDNMLDIVWSVDPNHDTIGSVIGRLQSFYQRMEGADALTVNWHIGAGIEDMPLAPRSRRNLYLILKEAVNNAVKHSESTRVDVNIGREMSMLRIMVQDFGRGFDARLVVAGYGLKTMQERAAESSAELSIHSRPGSATTIIVKWPLK